MLRNPELILELQSAVGASLWQCQALEESLIHVLLIGNKVERDSSIDMVEDLFNKYGKRTLGDLASQVESLSDVPDEIKERLRHFKNERNWLAHKSWADTLPYANSFPPTELNSYLTRINKIGDDALELNDLFKEILDERVKRFGVSKKYLEKKTQEIYTRWLAG